MFRENVLKSFKLHISCKYFLSFLKIGKSTNWEDDGWGAWETEPQEPVSLYKCVLALWQWPFPFAAMVTYFDVRSTFKDLCQGHFCAY